MRNASSNEHRKFGSIYVGEHRRCGTSFFFLFSMSTQQTLTILFWKDVRFQITPDDIWTPNVLCMYLSYDKNSGSATKFLCCRLDPAVSQTRTWFGVGRYNNALYLRPSWVTGGVSRMYLGLINKSRAGAKLWCYAPNCVITGPKQRRRMGFWHCVLSGRPVSLCFIFEYIMSLLMATTITDMVDSWKDATLFETLNVY